MTWLSKVGSVLSRVLGFVTGIAPLVGPAFGQQAQQVVTTTASELTKLRDVIVTVETAFQAAFPPSGTEKTGPMKLKAAVPFFSKIINQSEAFAGIKIANQDKYNAAITGIASAFADLLNSFSPDSAQTKE